MALTGRIVASIYRKGINNLVTGGMGRSRTFPSALCNTLPADLGVTADGVTMNAVIELLPSGLGNVTKQYWTDSTPAQLITNGS